MTQAGDGYRAGDGDLADGRVHASEIANEGISASELDSVASGPLS